MATAVLSVMIVIKNKMGIKPKLDVISMLVGMIGASAFISWLIHFMLGVGYGLALSQINKFLSGSVITIGIVIGILGWLM